MHFSDQNLQEVIGFLQKLYPKYELPLQQIEDILAYLKNDKKNAFTSVHVRQALGLWAMYFILAWVVSGLDSWFATFGFWVFFGILFIYGFINS